MNLHGLIAPVLCSIVGYVWLCSKYVEINSLERLKSEEKTNSTISPLPEVSVDTAQRSSLRSGMARYYTVWKYQVLSTFADA